MRPSWQRTASPAFARKREFIPIALESSPATTIVKISVLPMRMTEALATAAQEPPKATACVGPRWRAARHDLFRDFAAAIAARNDAARHPGRATKFTQACAQLGGHATIPWCPRGMEIRAEGLGLPRADFAQMQKLKNVFDPQRHLSPGRFVGGI